MKAGAAFAFVTGLLATLGGSACAPDGDEAIRTEVITIDTVDGIPRITNPDSGPWQSGEGWTIGPPELRLGGPEAPLETSWGSVAGAVIADDGTLYVADAQTQEVRYFRLDGTHLGTFGGEGEGPGEFRFIDALALSSSGTLAVRDPLGRRVTLFTPEGSFVTSYRLRGGAQLRLEVSPDLWIDRDLRVFDPFTIERDDATGSGLLGRGFVVYDSLGTVVDSVETVTWTSTAVTVTDEEGKRAQFAVPFAPLGRAAVRPDGTIVAGVPDRYALHAYDVGRGLVRIIRVDVSAVPLSADDRDGADQALETQLERARNLIDFGVTEVPDVELPATRPHFGSLYTDPHGNIWVGEYALPQERPERFDVFDRDGRLLGGVAVPATEIAHVGTEWIVGVEEDELGVEYVVVWPIVR